MDDTNKAAPTADFDLADLDTADEAEMEVIANGKPTGWIWKFSGPGHPKTVEYGNRMAKERLHKERMIQQAQANGRKWKEPVETVEDVKDRNVSIVLARMLGWSPIKMNGEDYPFTQENAKALLLDPKKAALLLQALEFLGDDASFINRSANN